MRMTPNVNGKPAAITADDPQMPLLKIVTLEGPDGGASAVTGPCQRVQ